MTWRMVDTEEWGKRSFEKLSKDAKLLCLYIRYNNQCSVSGVSEISEDFIGYQTKIVVEELPVLFAELKSVGIERIGEYIWDKGFILRQTCNKNKLTDKHKIAIINSFNNIPEDLAVKIKEYNRQLLSLGGDDDGNKEPTPESKDRGKYGKAKKQ